MLVRHAVIATFVLLAACGDGAGTAVRRPPAPDLLLSPVDGGSFTQNDATLGCPAHPARGYGFRVRFDWKDVEGATAYRLRFQQRDAPLAAINDVVVTTSQFEQTRCNAFVVDRNLEHWVWKVAAIAAPSDTLLWSETREFAFAPCRLADGRACYAPPVDTMP